MENTVEKKVNAKTYQYHKVKRELLAAMGKVIKEEKTYTTTGIKNKRSVNSNLGSQGAFIRMICDTQLLRISSVKLSIPGARTLDPN